MSSKLSFVSSPNVVFHRPCLMRPLRATLGCTLPPACCPAAGQPAAMVAPAASIASASRLFIPRSPMHDRTHLMPWCARGKASSRSGGRDAIGPHVGAQRLGNHDRAVGLLIVLE